MFLKEFVKGIIPLNLTLEQAEPFLQNLICRPCEYYKATKGTIYHSQWPRYVRNGRSWVNFIIKYGDEAAQRCDWSKLLTSDWLILLTRCPQYSRYFFGWEKFSASSWVELLRKHPQFVDHCAWYKFQHRHWLLLIHEREHLVQYYGRFLESREKHEIYRLSKLTKYEKMIELKRQKLLETNQYITDKQADELAIEQIRQEQLRFLRPERRTLDI